MAITCRNNCDDTIRNKYYSPLDLELHKSAEPAANTEKHTVVVLYTLINRYKHLVWEGVCQGACAMLPASGLGGIVYQCQ